MCNKKFVVSIPEKMFIGMSKEIKEKHGFSIQEACQALLSYYAEDREGRAILDAILYTMVRMREQTGMVYVEGVY